MNKKTYVPTASTINRAWHVVDVKDQVLGRVSTQIARLLMGKHKTTYIANLDCGDYVVVTNASQIQVTGNKMADKMYYRHSMIPGGFKAETYQDKFNRNPESVLIESVKGMLPKNKLRTDRLKRLKVFAASEHPYADKLSIDSSK